jgi:hypothetical protein
MSLCIVYSLLVCICVCSDRKIPTNCEQKQKMAAVEGTLTTKLQFPPLKKKSQDNKIAQCIMFYFSKIKVKSTQDQNMKVQMA